MRVSKTKTISWTFLSSSSDSFLICLVKKIIVKVVVVVVLLSLSLSLSNVKKEKKKKKKQKRLLLPLPKKALPLPPPPPPNKKKNKRKKERKREREKKERFYMGTRLSNKSENSETLFFWFPFSFPPPSSLSKKYRTYPLCLDT